MTENRLTRISGKSRAQASKRTKGFSPDVRHGRLTGASHRPLQTSGFAAIIQLSDGTSVAFLTMEGLLRSLDA